MKSSKRLRSALEVRHELGETADEAGAGLEECRSSKCRAGHSLGRVWDVIEQKAEAGLS